MKKPYECKVEGGHRFPLELSSECIREALRFVPRDEDLGVVTYPRSGTTWTQQIVLRLLRNGEFNGSWNDLSSKSPCLELQGTQAIIGSKQPVFYKTHIPYHPSRFNPRSKYIWVIRNPRDVCVSNYHLYSDLHQVPWRKRFPFEDYAEHFCTDEVYFGGYWGHLNSWWQVKDEPNVLMLVYEKMKKDPRGSIVQIGEFLGGRAAELVRDDEVVEALMSCTSVNATRSAANATFVRSLFRFNKLDTSLTKEFLRPRHAFWKIICGEVSFVRKGVVGDWENHFTPKLNQIFDEWIRRQENSEEAMALFESEPASSIDKSIVSND